MPDTHLRTVLVGFAVIAAAALSGCGVLTEPDDPTPTVSTNADPVPAESSTAPEPKTIDTTIVRVVDGDTIAVEAVAGLDANTSTGDGHSVRLLGIDAAEMNRHTDAEAECGAEAATEHLEGMLSTGDDVTLVYDDMADRNDHYGRSLAYVERAGSQDVNLAQVADGYAMPWYPSSASEPERLGQYRDAATTAVSANLGAHSECDAIGRG